jgi:hypothetical protein
VAWWAIGAGFEAGAKLRVVHTKPGGQFEAEQTSSEQSLSDSKVVFATSLPVHLDDLIGATVHDGDGESGVETASDPNSAVNEFSGAFPDGTTQPGNLIDDTQLQLGALFVFQPVVTGLSIAKGSTAGGQRVVITGQHLTQSTSVRFGSVPASKFTINSNASITTTAPAAHAGPVDVTVAGPGGRSATTSRDRYTFLTPKLRVSPASTLDFGGVGVGKASRVHSVTLTNTGSVMVSVGRTRLTGADAGEFTRSSDTCSDRTVAPGRSCSVKLVFVPRAKGTRDATLIIDDDAVGGPHRVVLRGTGKRAH